MLDLDAICDILSVLDIFIDAIFGRRRNLLATAEGVLYMLLRVYCFVCGSL